MRNNIKVAIIGAGYVGMGNALLFAKHHLTRLIDIDKNKVSLINKGISPLDDSLISSCLKRYKHNISADYKMNGDIRKFDYCLIALPTNFDNQKKEFDTSSIFNTLKKLNDIQYSNQIVIRSTVPVGFCKAMLKKFKELRISFFPEFLREGSALHDSLNPSRIIAGGEIQNTKEFADILKLLAKKKNIPTMFTSLEEAEAIKLFSNSYLAMRVAFFNELDTYALFNDLNAQEIIEGVCMDSRIGNYYNNPSFGFGGYCLPKDTMQLSSSFRSIPHKLIKSIVSSNASRKRSIVNYIVNSKFNKIGIYRLSMKKNSDNYRNSAVVDIIKSLKKHSKQLVIYEPVINASKFIGCKIENNFIAFCNESELIIANRFSKDLKNSQNVIFTRDLFNSA